MDYYFNKKPIIDEFNTYHNPKLQKQFIQNNNNMDFFRNNSSLKEKIISKKYRTSKNSSQKLIEDSPEYYNQKTNELFANKIKKIYSKKNNNLNFRDSSGNLLINKNYNKYFINNSGFGNNNINMSNINMSNLNLKKNINNINNINSNFAYNNNLLNYYNNNLIESNDFLNNNNYNNIKNNNTNKVFMKKMYHKNYNDELDEIFIEPENSYNNFVHNNGDLSKYNNNIHKKKNINAYKKVSENKLVGNYMNFNNFKKLNDKMLMENKIFNSHQRIKSNEDSQNKIKKIYNLKYKKEMPKYIIKYNGNNNNNNNMSGMNLINKKINNYLNNSDFNYLGLSSELSKFDYNNLNKTTKINHNNNINNINLDNYNENNQINNLINSIEGYINIKNEIKKENIYSNRTSKEKKSMINQKINNHRFFSSKDKNLDNNNINNYNKVQMMQNKSENKMRLKKVLNSNLRKKVKEKSEITNEVGVTSSSNIKTTYFSSFNNNINNNTNNSKNNFKNNINKIQTNENSISVSKTNNNNLNTIINDKKNYAENNFNNLVIKEYATKENAKEKEKPKIKYNSSNNSFTNKIYQKKISSPKDYLSSNNSIKNIKMKTIKQNDIDINKIFTNNSNINIISDNNSKIKTEAKNLKLKGNLLSPRDKNDKDKNVKNILKEENINKNDNNKNKVEVNSTYKTNEFETKNLSEFPINENIIIKNNIEEHNNLYINNNNITILNEKYKEENNKVDDKIEIKKDTNLIETKDIFNSIQSSDTLLNKAKNLEQLNSNFVKKEKEIINENKNIEKNNEKNNKKNEIDIVKEIKEDKINNDNKKDEINILINKKINDEKGKKEEKKEEKIESNNIEIITDNKDVTSEDKKIEENKNKIDLNFLKENILREIKVDLNNVEKEKNQEKEDIKIKEEKEKEKNNIIKEDIKIEEIKNKKDEDNEKEKEKDNNIIIINEDAKKESPLDNSKTKNKRELHKQNEKFMNLYKQDMLCILSKANDLKTTSRINLDLSTLTKECSFYKKKQAKLSEEIREYYKQNKKYPESTINYYLYGRQIGHGAFGQVNLALHIGSGRLVAIKIFAKKNLKNTRSREKILTEIETLSNFHHPFINQILDNFETDTHIFIVMEYVCGDLLGFIRKRSKLSESVSKIIFKQLIEGLKYIHKKHFVHRDIKLDNILIDLTNTIKICDFGVSKYFEDKNEIMFDHCGTPAYIAPEIFDHSGYKGPACDVWSAGVTLYYMLAGEQPFKAGSISELLKVNPKQRLSLDEILNHKWLDKVDLSQRHKLNLFTDAEKILMSKYDVNYLNSDKNELIENFTLKNIEDNNKNKNSGNTKSVIFAPYNTFIEEFENNNDSNLRNSNDFEEEKIYKELKVNNDICYFGIKAQQLNIQYELSNNGDFDNGLIKTEKQEDFLKENEKIEKMFETKKGKKWKNKEKYDDEYNMKNPRKDLLEKIEKEVGYKTDYVCKCLQKNKINYATATYFLLEKDEQVN